jgi:pyruvate kinase
MLGLMKAGVDIFRINFSHADYDESNIDHQRT